MRVATAVVVTLAVVLVVTADDKSTCEKKCSEKYENLDKKACEFGCSKRGSVASGGPFSFVTCHRACDDYANSTETEKNACHLACSLPMHSSIMMTLVNDNGKSRWKVVRQEGEDDPVTTIEDESPLGTFLGRSSDNNLLDLKAPASSSEEIEDDDSVEDGFGDFAKMHQRMEKMFQEMRRQFVENVISNMQDPNVARQRPSGHSPWRTNSISVGNDNEDGNGPIIITRPLMDSDEDDQNGIVLELRHRENRSRLMILFHWLLIVTGIVALFTTIFAIFLFLRSLRNNNYHRMGRDGGSTMPIFARVQPVSPLPVKKIPEEGWIDNSQPSGIAPPAYDQVSIHASPKMADSDQSTSEAETPSPTR